MHNYIRYTGMAFELFAIILVMVFIGKKLDEKFGLDKPIMVVSLVCFGMIGYIVKLYYQTSKKNNND